MALPISFPVHLHRLEFGWLLSNTPCFCLSRAKYWGLFSLPSPLLPFCCFYRFLLGKFIWLYLSFQSSFASSSSSSGANSADLIPFPSNPTAYAGGSASSAGFFSYKLSTKLMPNYYYCRLIYKFFFPVYRQQTLFCTKWHPLLRQLKCRRRC
jgi:hypothetical protein